MKYYRGNLLDMAEDGRFDLVIHGCNCLNTFGAGIAKQIKERYPEAYRVDQLTKKGDVAKLGKFTQTQVIGLNYNFLLINAYTQYSYGTDRPHVSYEAIRDVFTQVKMIYDMEVSLRIGIPMIGAGLAGGDWKLIEEIIDNIGFSDITCVIYEEK